VFQAALTEAGAAELNVPMTAGAGVACWPPAVWITRRGKLTPLQATGGWLD
jgi:hypothetical protein